MNRLKVSLTIFFLFLLFVFLSTTVTAKDEWIQVRSKNFFLVGNASEKDIRKVGTRLEQFRETFRLLFSGMNLTSPITTNVVVFKSDSAYKPFKPKRADGKLDTFVAGYFQPGEDVNYITLSTEGEDADTFSVIFHEYVHFIVNTNFGKSEVPPWFNEGLAEYYSTFAIENDQKVKLGLPQSNHLAMLQQNKLIPLSDLFKVTNFQLLQTGNHSRSIFYAESWALIHYLMQSGKTEGLGKFLDLILKNTPREKAFQNAFQTTYAQMEKELKDYVGRNSYKYNEITFKNKLIFDAEMQASPLSEGDSNAYLGDLLYHNHRAEDAEVFLQKALTASPGSSMANTTLGMVKLEQKKYDDAKSYLEKAISEDQKNHLAYYYYAFLLSREGRNEFGYVQSFSTDAAAKMRDALKKAIAIKPGFTESYELLAFVNLVNNEQLDESVILLRKALQYQPGNQRYAIRIAEIYLRQEKYADAGVLADKLAGTTDDPDIKGRAEDLGNQIKRIQQFKAEQESWRKQNETDTASSKAGKPELLHRGSGNRVLTDEELNKEAEMENLRTINRALRNPDKSEKRVIGYLQRIDCKNGVVFTVKTDSETFALVSSDFDRIALNAFVQLPGDSSVGCEADMSAVRAVITYKERAVPNDKARGDMSAIEFVPKGFRILSEDDLNKSQAIEPSGEMLDRQQQAAIMRSINRALNQPQAGEKREFGYLEKIECTSKGSYFQVRTATGVLRLSNSSPDASKIRLFTRELEGMQLGCAMKPVDVPAVVVYKDSPDPKSKSAGELVSLEFVPKTFILEQ